MYIYWHSGVQNLNLLGLVSPPHFYRNSIIGWSRRRVEGFRGTKIAVLSEVAMQGRHFGKVLPAFTGEGG